MVNFTTLNVSAERVDISIDGTHDTENIYRHAGYNHNGDIFFDAPLPEIISGAINYRGIFIKDADTGVVSLATSDEFGNDISISFAADAPLSHISSDDNLLLFKSGDRIAGDIANRDGDAFIKNLTTGDVTLASIPGPLVTSWDGGAGSDAVISPDGNYVAFDAGPKDSYEGENESNGLGILYDVQNDSVVSFTFDNDGITNNNGGSSIKTFSPDSSKLAFITTGTGFTGSSDTNGKYDLVVKDISTGAIQVVSTDASGNFGNNHSNGRVIFSPDGNKVYFSSTASNFVAGDTNGQRDIFVKDLTTGAIKRVNEDSNGDSVDYTSSEFALSADGNKIAFAQNYSGNTQIFVKDLITEEIYRFNVNGQLYAAYSAESLQFSPDGSKILFVSHKSLVPEDTDSHTNASNNLDIYEFDLNIRNVINGTNMCEQIDGTADADEIHGYGESDVIYGFAGDDMLYGDDGHDTIEGGDGNDTIFGNTEHDSLMGGDGDDEIHGAEGHDVVMGGAGNDTLYAGVEDQSDTLDGGAGDDQLYAIGLGNDQLTGGSGADIFTFIGIPTEATILDYTDGVDKIDLSSIGTIANFNDLTITDDLFGTLSIVASDGSAANSIVIHLDGFSASSSPLDATDFIF